MKELTKLKEPTQANEIEWRVQSNTSTGKTVIVPYIQNRAIMNRLDNIIGASFWRNEFEKWGEKGVKCGISIYIKEIEQWVTKFDGADETNIEPTKGGFSDSMKRAGVQWGIGRDLYEYPRVMLDEKVKFIPEWALKDLETITQNVLNGSNQDFYLIKNKGQSKNDPTKDFVKAPKVDPKIKDEIAGKLQKCDSVDDLSVLKGNYKSEIILHPEIKALLNARYREIKTA